MLRYSMVLAIAATLAGISDAGPFRRSRVTVATLPAKSATTQVKGDTSSASSVALLIVETNRFRHWGNTSCHPFEGIGLGATARQAIENCCYWGKRQAIDIGTAQMRNGQFVAVVRYR